MYPRFCCCNVQSAVHGIRQEVGDWTLTRVSRKGYIFLHKWEQDLNISFTEAQKTKILSLAHTSSISSRIAEVNYKVLTRWHLTPAALHGIFPQTSPLCWRGCGNRATHAHLWWYCPNIRPYWVSVLNCMKEIQGFETPNDPGVVLLHCTDRPVGPYKKSLTPHFLNAAKSLIPRYWKSNIIPTLRQWLEEVDHTYHMEDLTLSNRNKSDLATKIWADWFAFKFTTRYASIVS